MKSNNDFRKPVKNESYDSDGLKKAKKLKPVKKEKNVKRSLFKEIDEDEDLDLDYEDDTLEDDELFDDEDYDEDEEDN